MDETIYIGIDIGTTSVKVSIVNKEGKELVSRTEDTNAEIKGDVREQKFEQCPLKIMKVVESTYERVLSACQSSQHNVKGFGVSGQMHGIVLWKKLGVEQTTESDGKTKEPGARKSLTDLVCESHPSHLYTWQDQRCSPSFLATLPKPSNCKLPLSTGHGCATLFWLSCMGQGDVNLTQVGQFDWCGTIMDYFVYLLCGLEQPTTSDQLAASLGYFNQETGDWDSVLADTPEFPTHLMPKVVKAGTRAGVVRSSLPVWPSDQPVLVGMGDVQCAMAAVIRSPSQAAVNISTSIQMGLAVPSEDIPRIDRHRPPSVTFFPYFGHQHLALCAGLNGGNAVRHFVDCVANWMRQLGCDEDSCTTASVFSRLQQLAIEDWTQHDTADTTQHDTTHASPGLTVRPTFFGERHDPSLGAHISNISTSNFQNIGHIFRRVCEGVVSHLSAMVPPSFLKSLGIQELLVCGSVPQRNPLIRSAIQHMYGQAGVSVVVGSTEGGHQLSSAAGAAMMARKVLGLP